MKVLCLLGRHKWRVDNSDPVRPFEVCDRCGHYRNDVHVDWAADERGNPGTRYPPRHARGGGYVGGGYDGGGGGGDAGGGG